MCFDSTYEGLKRFADWSYAGQSTGFDSTYEGLKLKECTNLRARYSEFRQYL